MLIMINIMLNKVMKQQLLYLYVELVDQLMNPNQMILVVDSPVTLSSHRTLGFPTGRPISFYAQFINTRYEGGKSGEGKQKGGRNKKCRIRPKVKQSKPYFNWRESFISSSLVHGPWKKPNKYPTRCFYDQLLYHLCFFVNLFNSADKSECFLLKPLPPASF